MNPQSHRVIYNVARACRMVVAETARSGGKSCSTGGTRTTRRKRVSPGSCKKNRPLAPVDTAYTAINSVVSTFTGNSALTYTATEFNAYSENIQSSTSFLGGFNVGSSRSSTTTLDTRELGSKIFGKQVGIAAKNVEIVGADIAAKDQLSIQATDSVAITAATNTSSIQHSEAKHEFGFSGNLLSGISVGTDSSASTFQQASTSSSASTLSGSNVSISSGRDTSIRSSNVLADKNVAITAGNDINILAATNTQTSSERSESSSTRIGVVPGVGRQTLFSNSNTSGNGDSNASTQSTSLISANGGTLTMVAGNAITSQGADLLAQDKVSLVAKDVDLQAATNTSTSSSHFETSSFTVGAAAAGTVGSKITAITDTLQVARDTSNDRLKGAATLKAGYDAYKLVNGGAQEAIATQGSTPSGDPGGSAFGVSVSVGSSSSKQDSATATSSVRGTNIQAKDIRITATDGNITATAAKLQGENIALDAKKDVNLMAGVNSTSLQNSSESHNVGAGVTFGLGQQSGISFQLNAGQTNGNANGAETSFDNTRITATNTLTVKSGNNTNLVGAQLAGNSVKMDIGTNGGGDLNIVTLQDKSKFDSEQHSSGINLSLCIPPLCYGTMVTGSVSKSDAELNHNYQSATGQSGIAAGTGGYAITVKGNTDLKGGAITSAAPQEQNTLKTGSLTSSDIANNQSTASSSSSLSVGYNGGSAMSTLLDNAKTNALTALAGGAGMPANGTQSGTTQSVIGKGNVTITGSGDGTKDASSATQVASLTSRDPSKANGALTNTLTLQQAQEVQAKRQIAAENAKAANLAGAAMDGMIGDLAKSKGWAPGSPQATLLHGLSGLAQSTIGGTNAASGFASGALNEQLVQPMSNYIAQNCDSCVVKNADGSPQKDVKGNFVLNQSGKDLLLTGSTLVGVGTAAAMGGNKADVAAGGNIAKNSTEFNLLKHLSDIKKGCGLAGCSDAATALANGSNVGKAQTLPSGATVQVVKGTDGSIGAVVTPPGGGDPVVMDARLYTAFSQMTPDKQQELLNSSDLQLTVTNTKIVAGDVLSSTGVGLRTYGNTVSGTLTDVGNTVVAVGTAVIKNGPYQNTPLDMPPTDDGRPPTAGGAAIGTVATLPAVVPCGPGVLCPVPPIIGVTGVTLPSNVTLSVGGNDSGNSDGNSTGNGTNGSASGTGAKSGANLSGTPSPALADSPYSPANVDNRVRPPYQSNPAHDTGSSLYNPNKTPEPVDAQGMYEQGAVRGGMGTWYAKGQNGYYQYFSDNAGTVHFSGTVPASKIPKSVLNVLGK